MIQQLIYSDDDLPSDLKCQILSFIRIEWSDGFSGQNQWRDWITKKEQHPVHTVLVENNILISYTGIVWKYLDHAGETFKTFGLSGVFTYPAFRGQGYGSRIVRSATEYIWRGDGDIAILFCGQRRRNFYSRQGWVAIDNATTLVGSQDNPKIESSLRMMLFISEKGKRAQSEFENQPLYFGEDSW